MCDKNKLRRSKSKNTWYFGVVKGTIERILPFFRNHILLICSILDICTVLHVSRHEECDNTSVGETPTADVAFLTEKVEKSVTMVSS